MNRRISSSILLLLLLSLLFTGCGAAREQSVASEPDFAGEEAAREAPAAAPPPAPAEPEPVFADGISVPLEDFLAQAVQAQEARVIIYTGSIALVVRDTR